MRGELRLDLSANFLHQKTTPGGPIYQWHGIRGRCLPAVFPCRNPPPSDVSPSRESSRGVTSPPPLNFRFFICCGTVQMMVGGLLLGKWHRGRISYPLPCSMGPIYIPAEMFYENLSREPITAQSCNLLGWTWAADLCIRLGWVWQAESPSHLAESSVGKGSEWGKRVFSCHWECREVGRGAPVCLSLLDQRLLSSCWHREYM